MPFLSFFSATHLGLDINPESIRFVALTQRNKRYRILQFGSEQVAQNIFIDNKIKEWPLLQDQLTTMCEKYHWRGKAAALALPVNLVRRQQIQLPKGLSETELETQVYLHIQRDLPGMTDTLCADFTVIPSDQSHVVNVHFTAARQEYVAQYAECVNAAGVNVKLMDVDVDAIARAARLKFEWQGKAFDLMQAPEYSLALGLAAREMPLW